MISFTPALRDFFAKTFNKHRAVVLFMTLAVVVNAFVEGVGMSLLMPILEGLNNPENLQPRHELSKSLANVLSFFAIPFTLKALFFIAISFFCLQGVIKYVRTILASKVGCLILDDIRENLFYSMLQGRISYIHAKKLGDLVNPFITEVEWARAAFMHFFNVLIEGFMAFAYVILALTISWKLSMVVWLFLALLYLVGRKRKILNRLGEAHSKALDHLGSAVTEYFTGIREIKLFGRQQYIDESFKSVSRAVSDTMFKVSEKSALFSLVYDLAGVVLLFAIVGVGASAFGMSGAEIVVFLGVLFRLIPRVNACQSSADTFVGLIPGIETIYRLQTEADRLKENYQPGKFKAEFQQTVEFKDVGFSYTNNEQLSLKNLNLVLSRGKSLALVGASGAGKSTFVDLVVRFNDPTQGKILVDGVDLKDLDLHGWRGLIGFVGQDNFLFNDTIINNIRFGKPEASEEDVIKACKLVHAHEFISAMPEGYHATVGDRGVRLSGGQRQRLSLARAILRDPRILILDEATSDLDSKSEHLIETSLNEIKKDRTVIIIAHRLATVEKADEIIVLNHGEIVERGPHRDLLKFDRHYAELYRLQFRQQELHPV